MSPFVTALRMYPKPVDRGFNMTAFEDELSWYLANAYVHSTPRVFVMFKALGEQAWFIHTASARGAVRDIIKLLPYPLPQVVWQAWRDDGRGSQFAVRWDRVERLLNLISKDN